MKSVTDFSFHRIHSAVSPELGAEVVAIWTQFGGLDAAEAQRRLSELVMIVKNKSGKVIGISTAAKTHLQQIQNHVYAYRCFILPEFRAPALDTQMIIRSKALLAEASLVGTEKRSVGIVVVVQNELLKNHWRQAVWPGADMMYIGDTPQGHHIRIGYFKGSKI